MIYFDSQNFYQPLLFENQPGRRRRKGETKMGDVFIERMVKKKIQGTDLLIIIGLILAAIVLCPVLLLVSLSFRLSMIGVLACVGVVFGAYKLLCTRLLEYEYSLTNGYVTVDKIMNKASRKRMTSFECSSAEDIGEYAKNAERLKNRSFDARIFASADASYEKAWYMIVQSGKTGKTLVVFDPDEDFLDAVKKFIPRPLKFEVFGRNA